MNPWVAGIDLGGTKIEIGLVSPDNHIVARQRFPTEDWRGPESVVERIASCIEALQTELPAEVVLQATGICCPGPLDHVTGTLIDPPNIPGLHYTPLGSLLQARLGMPVRMEHDAKATGLGEFHFGAGRDEASMIYIIVGTGVGAAIIVDGEVYRGMHNAAGECGHTTLDLHGVRCHCGAIGCTETFMSGPWLARRYTAAQQGVAPSLEVDANVTGEEVAGLAEQGDTTAQRIIAEAGEALGASVAGLAMILDIDFYVVGGSVAHCGDRFFEPARQSVPNYAFASVAERVKIVPNQLDTDGAILGCAWLARQAL